MKNELVIRKSNGDKQADEYTLAKILRELGWSLADSNGPRQAEIKTIMLTELKQFDGNLQSITDQQKALNRALKYMNLGLEYASMKKIANENKVDYELAKRIVVNKSLVDIYKAGKILFDKNKDSYNSLLEKMEIKIGDYWFRLINEKDYRMLRSLAEIDFSRGTYAEHDKSSAKFNLFRRLSLIFKILPINECNIEHFIRFGSRQKGIYPTEEGIVEVIFLSLLIACLFREEIELDRSKRDLQAKALQEEMLKKSIVDYHQAIKKNNGQFAKFLLENAEMMLDNQKGFEKAIVQYGQERLAEKERQINFLIDVIQVTTDEVNKFSGMVFFEQMKFREKLQHIKNMFTGFFQTAATTLQVDPPQNYTEIVMEDMEYIAKIAMKDIREFYKTIDDPDASQMEISKFWGEKVLFKYEKGGETAAQHCMNGNITSKRLAESTLKLIVDATKYFLSWPYEKQDEFFKHFNPHRFFNETKEPKEPILQIIRNLTPSTAESANESKDVDLYKQQKDWVSILFDKINWERVHPYVVGFLWFRISDHARNLLFTKRKQFRVSLSFTKSYYLCSDLSKEEEQKIDLRLLAFVVDYLINQDKLKTSKSWDELLLSASTQKEKAFIEQRRNELKK